MKRSNCAKKFRSGGVAAKFAVVAAVMAVMSAPVALAPAASANEPPPVPPSTTDSSVFGMSQQALNGESAPADCPAASVDVPAAEDARQQCLNAVRHAPTFEAERAIKYAFSKIGAPYSQDPVLRLGAYFDCSSFVGRAFSAAAAPVKRWNGVQADFYEQFSWTGAYVPIAYFSGGYRYGYEGTNVSRVQNFSDLKPGDIIIQFSSDASDPGKSSGNAGHAQIYIGDNKVIQAGGSSRQVNVAQHVNYLGQEWYFRYNTLSTSKTGSQPPMQAGETQKVNVGAPSATVYGNLTVTDVLDSGYTTVYPCDQARPLASNSNYTPGRNVGTFVVTRSDPQGNICIYTSNRANIIWDQIFTTWEIGSHSPTRIVDTRSIPAAPVAGGETRKVSTGKPSTLVAGTVTAVNPTAAGYLTLYPCDQPRPVASNINFVAGQTIANTAIVRTDGKGDFCVFASTQTHLIWDQTVETQNIPSNGLRRVLDTRNNIPAGAAKIPANTVRILARTQLADATAYGNLTVTQPDGPGWVAVWPCGQPRPLASTINFVAGQTVANFAAVSTGVNGDVCVYSTAPTHLLWDETAVTVNQKVSSPRRLLDTRII